jgi:hypothetical protein
MRLTAPAKQSPTNYLAYYQPATALALSAMNIERAENT